MRTFAFEGRKGSAPLRAAMMILAKLDGDWRLPDGVPLGHIERRFGHHTGTRQERYHRRCDISTLLESDAPALPLSRF